MTNSFTPRPYQQEALDALNDYMHNKQGNPCVSIPTGGGKSLLIAWSTMMWKRAYLPLRVIVLAHRKELITQNYEEMQNVCSDYNLGIYSAGLKRRDMDNDVIYASIDSVYKRGGEFKPFDIIIIDEAHRLSPKAETKYQKFIKMQQFQNKHVKVIGFTATPYRMSGPLCHKDHILNEICYEANVKDLIEQGYLCKLWSQRKKVQPDLKDVKRNSKGDYILNSLSKAVDKEKLIQETVKDAVSIIEAEKRKSVIFFCVDIKHCKHVSQELMKYGIDAQMVTAKTPAKERDRIAERFKSGHIQCLCNVGIYTEGFNAKRVDCIALLRPSLSKGLYVQMPGRGLRLHPSKENCIAEGQRVLTDRGLIPIEKITINMKVWDGTEFVCHEGVICKGEKNVIEYAGLIATPDHKVWTKNGKKTFSECTKNKERIVVTGYGRETIRKTDNHFRKDKDGSCTKKNGFNSMHIMQKNQMETSNKSQKKSGWMSKMWQKIKRKQTLSWSSKMAVKPLYSSQGKVLESELERIQELWRTWCTVSFQVSESNGGMDYGESAIKAEIANRQNRQRWALRSRESANGRSKNKYEQSKGKYGNEKNAQVQNRTSRNNVCRFDPNKLTWAKKDDISTGHKAVQKKVRQTKRRVWDILNAGPRHRFTCEGLLVSNCLILDYAGLIDEHGPIDTLGEGEVRLYECDNCQNIFSRQIKKCPMCGWVIPKQVIERLENEERERKLHEARISNRSILSGEPEEYPVDDVFVYCHRKRDKPDSLRVEYRSGLNTFREWICLEHEGYAKQAAARWWVKRFGDDDIPSVSEAVEESMFLAESLKNMTKAVTIKRMGKYPQIISYELER